MPVEIALTRDLNAETLYALLALRSEVFVVEQECAYLDLDGRDLEPETRQLWIADITAPTRGATPGAPIGRSGAASVTGMQATLRLLLDTDATTGDAVAWRIGRVATAHHARSQGLAAELMTAALATARDAGRTDVIRLEAQSHLADWYARFGFSRSGPDYVEDGIPHTPMQAQL